MLLNKRSTSYRYWRTEAEQAAWDGLSDEDKAERPRPVLYNFQILTYGETIGYKRIYSSNC